MLSNISDYSAHVGSENVNVSTHNSIDTSTKNLLKSHIISEPDKR